MNPFRLAVLILGAGASSRMGRPKLLLPWGSETILTHSISLWRSAGAGQIAVVCGPFPHPLFSALDLLPDVARIVNPAPEQGMFSSIQSAANWPNWRTDLTHVAISLGDQPQIRPETIRVLLDFTAARHDQICQPSFRDRPKHPVILPRRNFLELKATPAHNLRDFLNFQPNRSTIPIEDPGLDFDLDTPAQYEAALNASKKGEQNPRI